MELRYDLLPKPDRQKIRAAMIEEMKRTLAADRIGYTPAQVNAAAGGGKGSSKPSKKVTAGGADDDHFADVDLGDDLLPS